MYVCMYACMCVCMYVRTYVRMYVCMMMMIVGDGDDDGDGCQQTSISHMQVRSVASDALKRRAPTIRQQMLINHSKV